MSLPHALRTGSSELGGDLLAPALEQSCSYDRAVGFFSSSVFAVAPEQWGAFFAHGGKYRVICSPLLGAADIAAIRLALVSPRQAALKQDQALVAIRAGHTAKALASWLASGAVLMMIARPRMQRLGIYHEKIAMFRDDDGNVLATSGSTNESRTAWQHNIERVDIFASWHGEDGLRRAERIQASFREMWSNSTEGLEVLSLQAAMLDGVLTVRPSAMTQVADEPAGLATVGGPPPEICAAPPDKSLRSHQDEAIKAWVNCQGRGILAMATGAGKTLTALFLIARMRAKSDAPLAVLIVAPYIHLVDQWCDNARLFGMRPIRCAEGRHRWQDELALAVNMTNAGHRPILTIAVTQATLSSEAFTTLIARIRVTLVIIGDEVHNYSAPDTINALPKQAQFRIGLSATPERYRDPEGTERLLNYFGPVVFRYGLAEAIRDNVLTPYRYFPVRVGLDDDEYQQYFEITRQLSRFRIDDDTTNDIALMLLLKRSRVLASARSKVPALRELLLDDGSQSHILVYCGDGQVEGDVPEEQMRQVESVVKMVGVDLRMRCASYTADTPSETRRSLLKAFASGDLQVLVAIRCLDEGVDVPAARIAYLLASGSNPRQFVQRRGRVLRRSPGKDAATIYDLMAIPDMSDVGEGSPLYGPSRSLVSRELKRAAEFAELALNGPQARSKLLDLTDQLALYDEWNI
jgi:DNA phosphorothioation system restriction enzyme